MKKEIILLLCPFILLPLAGCASTPSSSKFANQSSNVAAVLEAGIAKEEDTVESTEEAIDESAKESGSERQSGLNEDAPQPEPATEGELVFSHTEGIDVDLTALSSTLVYSEVYNMITSPEDYLGKIVRMDGSFALYVDESTDTYYSACIIADATACCAQGLEFVLGDEYTFPEDYPELGEEICVVGTFDTYQEGEYLYCTLRDARFV